MRREDAPGAVPDHVQFPGGGDLPAGDLHHLSRRFRKQLHATLLLRMRRGEARVFLHFAPQRASWPRGRQLERLVLGFDQAIAQLCGPASRRACGPCALPRTVSLRVAGAPWPPAGSFSVVNDRRRSAPAYWSVCVSRAWRCAPSSKSCDVRVNDVSKRPGARRSYYRRSCVSHPPGGR